MFYDPENARIQGFRPEERADPCFTTRKTRGSRFFDLENARIHAREKLGWDKFAGPTAQRRVREAAISNVHMCFGVFGVL